MAWKESVVMIPEVREKHQRELNSRHAPMQYIAKLPMPQPSDTSSATCTTQYTSDSKTIPSRGRIFFLTDCTLHPRTLPRCTEMPPELARCTPHQMYTSSSDVRQMFTSTTDVNKINNLSGNTKSAYISPSVVN